MLSPEWILAVRRLGLVVDPVEAGEGDGFLVPEVGRLKEGIKLQSKCILTVVFKVTNYRSGII